VKNDDERIEMETRPRTRSIRFGRSVSIESPSGAKLIKNQNRLSQPKTPEQTETVALFRLNSLATDRASFEIIGIAWVYGTNVVTRDFNFMFETKLSVYWRVCWGVLCPLLLPTLFIYLVFVDGGPFVKVDIAESSKQTMAICGYTLAGLGLLLVPLHLLFTITADEQGERFLVRLWNTIRGGRFGEKLRDAFLPNNSWGPSSIKERKEWQVYSETHSKLEFLPSGLRSRLERGSTSTQELPK